MAVLKLYYATNRKHRGRDQWHPSSYSTKPSSDGGENLRFGVLRVNVDQAEVNKCLSRKVKGCGVGDGVRLSKYLAKKAKRAKISAYPEEIDDSVAEDVQTDLKLGSKAMMADLQSDMMAAKDVLINIHGFNVSWEDSVGAALSLQTMLNAVEGDHQEVVVVLFSWPSDGMALPYVSYKSDLSEARDSGYAIGRGLLKVRDYLKNIKDRAKGSGDVLCGQEIHLLCHSMGNYLLQKALGRISEFTIGPVLPRVFDHVFLCSADVDDDALEEDEKLGKLTQLSRGISVYHNRGDFALGISDHTKSNPDRLGSAGVAHPARLHQKINQVDCSPVVHGVVEHSYYLVGNILRDIRMSLDGVEPSSDERSRVQSSAYSNVWKIK